MKGQGLPKRPRSHVLETESRNWVRQCFPSEWTVEDVHSDYGTDLEVEVFHDYQPTGLKLDVQVKSKDKDFPIGSTFAYQAEVPWLNYCLTRPSPVILVHYFARDKRAIWVWVKDYIRLELDISRPTWDRQKTTTLQIPTSREFGAGCKGEILARLYSGDWERVGKNYRWLIALAEPTSEPDVLGLAPLAVDDTELNRLLAILPAEADGRVRRVHSIVQKVRDQSPLTIDDGKYVAEHLPALTSWLGQQRGKLSQCQSNLKQLGLAALMFEQDEGRLPSSEDWRTELLPYTQNEEFFRCPACDDEGYALNPLVAGKPLQTCARSPLFFDSTAEQTAPEYRHLLGCCVVMTDGHSEWLEPAQLDPLLGKR